MVARSVTIQSPDSDWTEWPPIGTCFDSHAMRVEETEEPGCLIVRAELPGIDCDTDLFVQVREHMLDIRAQRAAANPTSSGRVRRSEFQHGRFWRAMSLPEDAHESGLEASYENGIVEVRVPLGDAPPR